MADPLHEPSPPVPPPSSIQSTQSIQISLPVVHVATAVVDQSDAEALRNLPHPVLFPGIMPPVTKSYHDDPEWSDIEPLPQDDTGRPLAAIAYTDEYSEAMSYLRAVMAKNEYSERVLDLTEHIIEMNPAHYTVWYVVGCHLYRDGVAN
jgi:hypothetical protein